MYKKWLFHLSLLIAVFILSSCSDNGENEYLPESCRTYNQFIYTTSDDFYKLLLDNGYTIDEDHYYDSVVNVKNITYTEQITISGNELDLNGIQCFPYINTLALEGKSVKDVSPVNDLKRVETLTINNTKIMTLLPFQNMVKLKSLTVTNNSSLISVNGTQAFKRLQTVDLSNNRLIDIEPLKELTNLEQVILKENDIKTIDALSTLPKLEYLDIEHNLVDFNDRDTISGFKALQTLKGKSNRICETRAFSSFEQLTFLDLSDNNLMNALNDSSCTLTEPDFTFLNKVTTLERFYVTENELQNLESLKDAKISHLKELNLSNNQLKSIQPLFYNSSIQNGNLTTLDVSNNEPLTTLDGINNIKTLESLSADNSSISQIEDVFLLSNLVDADLSNNQIMTLPSTITSDGTVLLPSIKTLNVSNNMIERIEDFNENQSLLTIDLTDNNIKEISNSFNNMAQLQTILLTELTEDDQKENRIQRIEASFNNLANLELEEAGVLELNFNTQEDTGNQDGLMIMESFNDMAQFIAVDLANRKISHIDEDSFKLAQVTQFDASKNKLTELEWINNLPNLLALLAAHNNIEINNAAKIQPSKIQALDLGNNELTDIDFLKQMQDLRVVNLESNQISDVGVLNGNTYSFNNLEELSLKNNDIQIVNGIKQLPKLTTLNLEGNVIIEINGTNDQLAISHLPSLSTLLFGSEVRLTKINGLSSLGISELDIQTITDQAIEISSTSFSSNDHITRLDFTGKQILNGESNANQGFNFVANLDYVKELSLSNTGITDLAPLSNLRQLVILALINNSSNGESLHELAPLQNLKALETLLLDQNEIEDVSPLNNYPSLEVLSLEGNKITTLNGISDMPSLTTLNLELNPIQKIDGLNNIGLDSLSLYSFSIDSITSNSLKENHFTELDLSNQSISDISFARNLTYLETLNLSNNKITNMSPLTNLTNLVELDLGHNGVEDISEIGELTSLENLYLNDNLITTITTLQSGSVFDSLTQLESLNLSNNTFTELAGLNNMNNLEYLSFPTTVTSFNDTLSGTNSLVELNGQNPKFLFNNLDVQLKDYTIENSFNSRTFDEVVLPNGFNETVENSFKNVTYLDLSLTDYSQSSQLSFIEDMDVLSTFIYHGDSIQSLDHITCPSSLTTLDLSDSSISSVTGSFENCSNLRTINLSSTQLDDFSFLETNEQVETLELRSLSIGTLTFDISNMKQLSEVDLSGSTINKIYNSFNNNNSVTSIRFDAVSEIENSFNTLPSFTGNSYDSLKLRGTDGFFNVTNSFNKLSSLTNVEFMNFSSLVYVDNSFDEASNVTDLSFREPIYVRQLSGFSNISIEQLQSFRFLESIDGFEGASIEELQLSSQFITDSMLNKLISNIDQSSVEVVHISNSDFISQSSLLNNINELQNITELRIRNVELVQDLDGLSTGLINQLRIFEFDHNTPNSSAIMEVLALKTTTAHTLSIYEGNSGIDYDEGLRLVFETELRSDSSYMDALRTEITNQYDDELRQTYKTMYPNHTDTQISNEISNFKNQSEYDDEITLRIDQNILELVDESMNIYRIY